MKGFGLYESDRDVIKCGYCHKNIPKGVYYFHVGKFSGYMAKGNVSVNLCIKCLFRIKEDNNLNEMYGDCETKYKEYEERVLVKEVAHNL